MLVKLRRHGINTEKGQVGFYLDKKITPYSRHGIAMNKQRITKIEDEQKERRQKSLIYLPAFRLEQVDKIKNKEKQGAYLIGIIKSQYRSDQVI
jgi:hypothetical protein